MDVNAEFIVKRTPTAKLSEAALALVDGGWLTPEIYQRQQGDLAACITDAVAGVADTARPRPIASLAITVADTGERAEVGRDNGYSDHHKISAADVSVIVVHSTHEGKPVHRNIGPAIRRLEQRRPGLGHTVLWWLHRSLNLSARACDPLSGLGWAQSNYWMGEDNERDVIEEQLEEARSYHEVQQGELPAAEQTPFNEENALKEINMFTRAKYDEKIPKAVNRLTGPILTLNQLARVRLPGPPKRLAEVFSGAPNLIEATLAAAKLTAGDKYTGSAFENMRWEICPFLLRWDRDEKQQDHLGMIWDDFMNREFEAGETNMSAIAAWGWHDGPTLIQAVKNLDQWCRLLQAAETLLNLIQPEEIDD